MAKVLTAIRTAGRVPNPVKILNKKGIHFATVYKIRINSHLSMFKIVDTSGQNLKVHVMSYLKAKCSKVLIDSYNRYLVSSGLAHSWEL